MYITLHLSDGRKITKDEDKLLFFTGDRCERMNARPEVAEGFINVNMAHVVDMRPAEPDEIEHAKVHGW